MSSYVANFVANYNPNGPGLPQWPAQVRGQQSVMEVGNNYTQMALAQQQLAIKEDFLKRFYATQPIW
jgi:carboxylesterase type B